MFSPLKFIEAIRQDRENYSHQTAEVGSLLTGRTF